MPPFTSIDLSTIAPEERTPAIVNALLEFLMEMNGLTFTIYGKLDIPQNLFEQYLSELKLNFKGDPIMSIFIFIFFQTIYSELTKNDRLEMTLTPQYFHANGKLIFSFGANCNGICNKNKKDDEFAIQCRECDLDYCKDCMSLWNNDKSLFVVNEHCLSLLNKQ